MVAFYEPIYTDSTTCTCVTPTDAFTVISEFEDKTYGEPQPTSISVKNEIEEEIEKPKKFLVERRQKSVRAIKPRMPKIVSPPGGWFFFKG